MSGLDTPLRSFLAARLLDQRPDSGYSAGGGNVGRVAVPRNEERRIETTWSRPAAEPLWMTTAGNNRFGHGRPMPFDYMLRCSDGSYYVGSARNLDLRLHQHQLGVGAEYTRHRLPVELVWSAEYPNVGEAFFWEKRIQGWSRAKREALIRGDFDALPALAKKDFTRGRVGSDGLDTSSLVPHDRSLGDSGYPTGEAEPPPGSTGEGEPPPGSTGEAEPPPLVE